MAISLEQTFSDALLRLNKDPTDTDEILDLLLQWIQEGTIFHIENIERRIHEIANQNHNFSKNYIKKYVEKFKESWFLLDSPRLIHFFLPNEIGPVISTVAQIDHSRIPEKMIGMQFFRAMIQICNANCKNLNNMQSIAEHLLIIANATPFITNPYKQTDRYNFDALVDKSLKLIEDIEDRAHFQQMDFCKIFQKLSNYSTLEKYVKDFLNACVRDQDFSPLLSLLNDDTEENQVILNELDHGIQLYEILRNEKNTTNLRITQEIEKQLKNENDFWNFLSELIIMRKLGKDRIKVKDKKIGSKYIDLIVQMGEKTVLLEITTPDIQRDAKILIAGFLTSKYDSAINAKRQQLSEGLKTDSRIDASDLFYYVVIDGSKTPIAYEEMDLFTHNNQDEDLVSGVIIVKRKFIPGELRHYKLVGKIITNPKGKNILPSTELEELSRIIFG